MARPISTEQETGTSVWPPFARRVICEALGLLRYSSFNGFCSDRRPWQPHSVHFSLSKIHRGTKPPAFPLPSLFTPTESHVLTIDWISVCSDDFACGAQRGL